MEDVLLCVFVLQIRNVGSGMCMESKHFVSGSPVRLETCIKGRGEVSWSHGQVRGHVFTHRYKDSGAVSEQQRPLQPHVVTNPVFERWRGFQVYKKKKSMCL